MDGKENKHIFIANGKWQTSHLIQPIIENRQRISILDIFIYLHKKYNLTV